jgi:hypothetical protein
LSSALLHDLRGAQLVAAVDHRDLRREAGEEVASSIAVSPPPTTAIGLPLKSAPSQVAQAETPLFVSRFSESSPSQRADAPVATMIESAVYRFALGLDDEGALREVDAGRVLEHDRRAEALGLLLEFFHHLGDP